MLTKADKGKTIVIMEQDDYIKKTLELTNNNDFSHLKLNPTPEYQQQIKKMKKCATLVFQSTKSSLIKMNPKTPRLKALPKLLKENIPIRPLVNYRNAPNHDMAKFIAKYLSLNLNLENYYNMRYSFELCNSLKELSIAEDTFLHCF